MDNLPDDLNVDIEVIVDDAMSETNNLRPFDFWVLRPEILRQAVGGLSDDFEVSHDRVNGLLISHKRIVIHTGYIAFDLFNRFPNIFDQERRAPT
jgi:hypothetical protein